MNKTRFIVDLWPLLFSDSKTCVPKILINTDLAAFYKFLYIAFLFSSKYFMIGFDISCLTRGCVAACCRLPVQRFSYIFLAFDFQFNSTVIERHTFLSSIIWNMNNICLVTQNRGLLVNVFRHCLLLLISVNLEF